MEEFQRQAAAYRGTVAQRRLGFARYLVSIPAIEALARRREGDRSRRRRNFDLHARLGAPLREWYTALEEIRPGSVVWDFTSDAIESAPAARDRYDLADFDALMARVTAARD